MRRADTSVKCDRGFSLTEVMVVLCGFGILAGIGVPVLNTMMSEYGTVMAAQQIAVQLQNARMKAVTSNEPFRVNFVTANSYQIETGNGALHAGPFFLPAGTTFNTTDGTSITFPSGYVLFQPSGRLPFGGPGSAGRIKIISRNGLRVDIIVAPGGMIQTTPSYKTSTPPF